MRKRPFNILVVDDNAADVVLIGESLRQEQLPHALTHCLDGQQALELLTAADGHDFDIVILDLNMPKMGGLEVLAEVKSRPHLAGLPILVLTSSMMPGEQEEAMRLGAMRFMRKPNDLDGFLLHVGSAVRELVQSLQPT